MSEGLQRVPLYTQIYNYVSDGIKAGQWPPAGRLPSEKELSEQFNVSRITVKKALGQLIEEGLIYRIQGKGTFVAVGQNGEPALYKSNAPQGHSDCIAFLIPRLENTFTASLVRGIERECKEVGLKVILGITHDSQEIERELIRDSLNLGVKGIIIFPVDGEAYNEDILKLTMSNYPIVLIDRYFRGIESNCVCTDNVMGGYEATKHLLELGHVHTGVVTTISKWTTSIEDRLAGYEKALTEHEVPIDKRRWLRDYLPDDMNQVLRTGIVNKEIKKGIQDYLLANKELTAIFASNISCGLAVISAALDLGIRVPEQLSVIYYDFEPLPLLNLNPTCVIQDDQMIVKHAVQLLLAVIEDPNHKRTRILVPAKLQRGNSTQMLSLQE